MTEEKHFRLAVRAATASLVVGFAIMAVKFWAYFATGSAAVLSDALESIINVVAGGFALGSVIYAAAPPDENHPYGHGKIEYYAAGFEGSLIILAAGVIIWESWDKFFHPRELPNLDLGLALLAGAGLVNLLLGLLLVRTGKNTRSITLTADGKHVLTDVYTSGAVLVGLALVLLTGWLWLDPAVACLAALNIVVTGYRLVRQSFGALMHETDPELIAEICRVIEAKRKPAWLDVHKLRAWRSGRQTHVDFHLILPQDMRLDAAHDEVEDLENLLKEHFGPGADILIHADPCRNVACRVCVMDACHDRNAAFATRKPLDGDTAAAVSEGVVD